MDLKRITDTAKGLFDKRGGTDSLKEDAAEIKDIAKGEGSLTDKAKAAADALKDPGATESPAETPDPAAELADSPERREGRRDRPHRGRREGRRRRRAG
jgi:hypothetical protein